MMVRWMCGVCLRESEFGTVFSKIVFNLLS